MKRLVPFLILAGGAAALWFVWKQHQAALVADATARKIAADSSDCAARGGTFQATGGLTGGTCRLPDKPVNTLPAGSFGSCPDRQSCSGQTSPQYIGNQLFTGWHPAPPRN